MPTYICRTRNCQIFLRPTHWSYLTWKDILHTLNEYEISAEEHQIIDRSATYETSVLEILFWKYLEYVPLILRNYKKLKRTKIVIFIVSFFYMSNTSSASHYCKIRKCLHSENSRVNQKPSFFFRGNNLKLRRLTHSYTFHSTHLRLEHFF